MSQERLLAYVWIMGIGFKGPVFAAVATGIHIRETFIFHTNIA